MRDIPYSTLAGFFHACRNVAGSTIGSFKRKLNFSGKHDIVPEIETIKIKDVNEAYERVLKSDLRYHFLKDRHPSPEKQRQAVPTLASRLSPKGFPATPKCNGAEGKSEVSCVGWNRSEPLSEEQMRADIVPGAVFPDYELSDHTGKRRKLSELQGVYPTVVVLSRGSYCPKDRRQAEGLLQLHREMTVGYCRMVTISTDAIAETHEYRSGVGAQWPFLADPRRIIQKDLDIAEYTDPIHNPMIPHVIVLEPKLIVHKIYNGYWFFGRPTVEELRLDLRAVFMKAFADWDITKPALRDAWNGGRKDDFFPYGQILAETLGEA